MPGLALAGNRVSSDILALLDQFERLYLALDEDTGGHEGANRLADYFGSRAVRVRLPAGVKDEADLAKRHDGAQVFRAAILSAIDSAVLLVGGTDVRTGPDETERPVSMTGTESGLDRHERYRA